MHAEGTKVTGYDIGLLSKKYFVSSRRFNVIATVAALPFVYNWVTVGKKIYDTKKTNNGRIKITAADAGRMFGVDIVVVTVGLVAFLVLKNKAGLTFASRVVKAEKPKVKI